MMIKQLAVENFGCIRSVDVELTRLHAFIGPNDSGKSTLLQAIHVLSHFASPSLLWNSSTFNQPVTPKTHLRATRNDGSYYSLTALGDFTFREEAAIGDDKAAGTRDLSGQGATISRPPFDVLLKAICNSRLVRLDPDAMRKPSRIFPTNEFVQFDSERGSQLAGVYDAIRDRDVDDYKRIESQLKTLFDTIDKLQLRTVSNSRKILQIRLKNGTEIPAGQMSEGLLYYLGFAVLPYLQQAPILLVEEPENGLHPARIKDVVHVLREVSRHSQVLLATHSPLIINELEPEEVSVVTRTLENGTKVTPIKETPDFELRAKAYLLGELWLSYANGEDEAPLLDGGRRE